MVFLVPLVGFFGTLLLAVWLAGYAISPPYDRRNWQVPGSAILGYAAGGFLVWSLVPGSWRLSLWETLHAAFDVEKYGHPVEHVAESIVAWQMFAGVVGATLLGCAILMRRRRLTRYTPVADNRSSGVD